MKPSAVGCSRWDERALIDLEEGTARTEVVDIRYGAALTSGFQWALEDSNLRPLACKASALPLS